MHLYEMKRKQPTYIPPEVYNSKSPSLKPDDLTDVGEAEVLAREYKDVLRYSPATDFICYNRTFWEESKEMAHSIVHKLTKYQLREARNFKYEIDTQLEDTGTNEILAENTEKKALQKFDDAQVELYKQSGQAMKYLLFILGRRKSSNVVSTLKEAKPMLVIDPLTLDANEFLLNTPDGTIDLRTGKQKPHDPSDFITKVTTVSPDTKDMDIWLDALKTFFCDDEELIGEMPMLSGMVFCADCGSKLYQVRCKGWPHEREYMVCAQYRKKGKLTCTSHQIKNVDIETALLYSIQQVTAFAKEHEAEFVELVTKTNTKAAERAIRESRKEYEQATARIYKLDTFIQKLFEDNVEGKINDERFAKMSATYEAEQNELQERVIVLESIINEAKEKSANIDSFLEIVHRYTDIQELDAEIIRTFIEKVYVYQNEKLWSRDTKKLKIIFNFIGDIQIPNNEKTA